MTQHTEACQYHLKEALATDTLKEKDFHIRQALQISVVKDDSGN
ncbi:hypothetical protein [Halorubrum halophilum]|nr:hypothetical protein [Halorubrum halophilum]